MDFLANGMAFDIAFIEDSDESIIKKHPPKRFQKLEESQTSPTVTLVKLQEKLEEAEIRRQQVKNLYKKSLLNKCQSQTVCF